jgi:hypothetical protein
VIVDASSPFLSLQESILSPELLRRFRLPLAHSQNASTLMAVIASLEYADTLDRTATIGVIATGPSAHVEMAMEFSRRILRHGPMNANPLAFPNTLPSSTASSVAQRIGAHGPVFSTGPDELGFFDALHAARLVLTNGLADQVLLPACLTDTAVHCAARESLANYQSGATVALCGLATLQRHAGRCAWVGDVGVRLRADVVDLSNLDAVMRVSSNETSYRLAKGAPVTCVSAPLFATSGAFLLAHVLNECRSQPLHSGVALAAGGLLSKVTLREDYR